MRPLYIAIGVDCDPDRDVYPEIAFRGLESCRQLFDIPDVKFTLNIRADNQVRNCFSSYRDTIANLRDAGYEIAWHLHYYDDNDKQSRATNIIIDNIETGTVRKPDDVTTVHMGWLYQDDLSLSHLAKAGVKIDYSPAPGIKQDGDNDFNDWSDFSYRPQIKCGIKMIPVYTYRDWLLSKKTGTERVLQHITTVPFIYKRLLNSFFNTGMDFFVTYFHADELIPALGDWRNKMYSIEFLKANIERLKRMAIKHGYEPKFVTIRELAKVLF